MTRNVFAGILISIFALIICAVIVDWIVKKFQGPSNNSLLRRIGNWWPAPNSNVEMRWWFQTRKGNTHMIVSLLLLILIFVFIPETWTALTHSLKWLLENKAVTLCFLMWWLCVFFWTYDKDYTPIQHYMKWITALLPLLVIIVWQWSTIKGLAHPIPIDPNNPPSEEQMAVLFKQGLFVWAIILVVAILLVWGLIKAGALKAVIIGAVVIIGIIIVVKVCAPVVKGVGEGLISFNKVGQATSQTQLFDHMSPPEESETQVSEPPRQIEARAPEPKQLYNAPAFVGGIPQQSPQYGYASTVVRPLGRGTVRLPSRQQSPRHQGYRRGR